MEKIGIFGGTFNPVHAEHVEVAIAAINELNLDKLIIMPTFSSPHKTLIPASAEDRINMLSIAFSGIDKAVISDYEIKKQGTSFTYLTVEHYKELYPNAKLFFIVGGDMLTDFKTWKFPERILAAATLAVFERENFKTDFAAEKKYFKQTFDKDFIKLSYIGKNFSSTKIRVYSMLNLDLEGICIPAVSNYIKERGVYRGDEKIDFLLSHLTKKRLIHTAGVAVTALKKAKELNLSESKVLTAALFHDCAKYLSPEDYPEFALPQNVPPPVVHEFLGAYVAEKIVGIFDPEVIDAIKYHTTGKANMTTLGKLIFVADMIEENRDYDGVDKLRAYFDGDFDKCFIECLKEETLHLLRKKMPVYFETVNAYDFYVNNNKQ